VNFTKADLDDPRFEVEKAWVRCPHCLREISQQNMVEPEKRAWVHHHPDIDEKSFYISPLDVPAINTPRKILENSRNYETHIVRNGKYLEAHREFWLRAGLGLLLYPGQQGEDVTPVPG